MKYWIVDTCLAPDEKDSRALRNSSSQRVKLSGEADALMRIEAEEEERLLMQQTSSMALDEELEHDENN